MTFFDAEGAHERAKMQEPLVRQEFVEMAERLVGLGDGLGYAKVLTVRIACALQSAASEERSRQQSALKEALTALSIIAVMGDHHSAKIAKKAIDAIAEEAK